jgi:radical SAM protein with 4Fe4S-binding SPASM domain
VLYSELRSAPRQNLAELIPLPSPFTVYVEPTNRCNLACTFCPQSLPDYVEQAGYSEHISLELFARVMDEIREMKIRSLKLHHLGETLMHPEIGEICRLAAAAAERVELTTNMIPLTPKKAAGIVESGINYIRVSWYGEQPERIERNLKLIYDMKQVKRVDRPQVCVKVFAKENLPEIDYLRPYIDDVCIDQLHTVGSHFVHLATYQENRRACTYPFYTMVVKANGDVVPCCVGWEKSLVIGNVKEKSLAEIWASPQMRAIQLAHLRGEKHALAACKSCDMAYSCPDSVDSVSTEEFERRLEPISRC